MIPLFLVLFCSSYSSSYSLLKKMRVALERKLRSFCFVLKIEHTSSRCDVGSLLRKPLLSFLLSLLPRLFSRSKIEPCHSLSLSSCKHEVTERYHKQRETIPVIFAKCLETRIVSSLEFQNKNISR
jgi:hypothetical protein